jgi:hypothetical protein
MSADVASADVIVSQSRQVTRQCCIGNVKLSQTGGSFRGSPEWKLHH